MAEHDSQTQLITELTSQLARILQTNNENQSQRHPDSLKISVTLNNSNYSLWSRMIKVAIGGKSEALLNHLTEDPPETNNQKWNQEDLVVFSWIIQNIEPQIASNLTQFTTAKTLWNALITTYSSGKDKLQTFDLHVKANNIRQEGKSTEELWLKLQGIWGEIEIRDPNPMEHPNDIVKYNNIRSEQKLFQFLNALDYKHDNIKRELLRIDPLPTVEGAYAAIRKENAHQYIFNNKTDVLTQSGIATGLVAPASKSKDFDSHGLLSRNQRRSDYTSSSRDKDNLECTKCGMKRHTREQCFKVIGYPDWWADRHRKGKTSMVTTATTKGKQEDNETGTTTQGGFGLFTAEPPSSSSSSSSGEGNRGLGLGIKSLKIIPNKLNKVGGDKYVDEYDGLGVSVTNSTPTTEFNSPNLFIDTNSPCNNIVGNKQIKPFFNKTKDFKIKNNVSSINIVSNKTKSNEWIIDCGATDTMTFNKNDIIINTKPNKTKIKTANGGIIQVKGGGTVEISPNLNLKNCLYVPDLSHKLLSISHVTKELNCTVLLHPTFCILQDIRTGEIIGRGTERDGLYYVDEVTKDGRIMLAHGTPDRQAWLWHRRLGHPSAGYLHILFPNLFSSNNSIECETCILAKSHQNSFKTSNTKTERPFALVHSDVWGPARVNGGHSFRYFLLFIDDCTRMTWTYFLTNKSEVFDKFTTFSNMVQTQFQSKIQVLRSDNGGEFVNSQMKLFCEERGIIHQTTCPHTPQQNRVAERKNRILLEITRALMIESNVPRSFWP
ncbi:uncharacterized protein [Rutidosis leptorrhynchoides]|uniref:uncharacterized protein n=1 Tax=Rutidosis leptorrhynchoides TaxID=125765 RepID=UPI003A9A1F9A